MNLDTGRIGLVVSDVDGTLVDPDKRLTPATIAAVKRLTAAGLPFTIISARPPSGMMALAEALALRGPVAAFNGGMILKTDATVLAHHPIAPEVVRGMFELAAGSTATPWLFAQGQWFVRDPANPHVAHERIASAQDPVIRDDFSGLFGCADKLTFVSDDPPVLVALHEQAAAAFGLRATIAQSQTYYLDVTDLAANKGDGLLALAEACGVDLAEVAVIGDMPNDLPMFARAGFRIAMGQAPEAVRAAADAVTASNAEDGVARAIERILLPRLAG